MDGGIVECGPLACPSCPEGQVPVSKSGLCCPVCLADWAWEKEEVFEVTEGEGPVTLQCLLHDWVLVAPDDVSSWGAEKVKPLEPMILILPYSCFPRSKN